MIKFDTKVSEEIYVSWVQEARDLIKSNNPTKIEDYIIKAHNPKEEEIVKIREVIVEIVFGENTITRELLQATPTTLRKNCDGYLKRISKVENTIQQKYLVCKLAEKTGVSQKVMFEHLKEVLGSVEEKQIMSATELLEMDMPEIKFWSRPMFAKGEITLIGGTAGVGKSLLALASSVGMVLGKDILNCITIDEKPNKILYYDIENGPKITRNRLVYLKNFFGAENKDLENLTIVYDFNKKNIKKELELSENYDVVVLDSYRRFLEGEENSSEITDRFYNEFLKPLKDNEVSLAILQNLNKRSLSDISNDDLLNMFRGSSDIVAQITQAFLLFKGPEESSKNNNKLAFDVTVLHKKNRLGVPTKNFRLKILKDDTIRQTVFLPLEFKGLLTPAARAYDKIVDLLHANGSLTRAEFVKKLINSNVCSEPSVDNYLKHLISVGRIIKEKYGVYTLPKEQTGVKNYV